MKKESITKQNSKKSPIIYIITGLTAILMIIGAIAVSLNLSNQQTAPEESEASTDGLSNIPDPQDIKMEKIISQEGDIYELFSGEYGSMETSFQNAIHNGKWNIENGWLINSGGNASAKPNPDQDPNITEKVKTSTTAIIQLNQPSLISQIDFQLKWGNTNLFGNKAAIKFSHAQSTEGPWTDFKTIIVERSDESGIISESINKTDIIKTEFEKPNYVPNVANFVKFEWLNCEEAEISCGKNNWNGFASVKNIEIIGYTQNILEEILYSDGSTKITTTQTPTPSTDQKKTLKCGEDCSAYAEGDKSQGCEIGTMCLETKAGGYYCAKPELRKYCSEDPSQESCCVGVSDKDTVKEDNNEEDNEVDKNTKTSDKNPESTSAASSSLNGEILIDQIVEQHGDLYDYYDGKYGSIDTAYTNLIDKNTNLWKEGNQWRNITNKSYLVFKLLDSSTVMKIEYAIKWDKRDDYFGDEAPIKISYSNDMKNWQLLDERLVPRANKINPSVDDSDYEPSEVEILLDRSIQAKYLKFEWIECDTKTKNCGVYPSKNTPSTWNGWGSLRYFNIYGDATTSSSETKEPEITTCSETDGGNDEFSRGTVVLRYSDNTTEKETDICENGSSLSEKNCSIDTNDNYTGIETKTINCEYGCENGKCIEEDTSGSENACFANCKSPGDTSCGNGYSCILVDRHYKCVDNNALTNSKCYQDGQESACCP